MEEKSVQRIDSVTLAEKAVFDENGYLIDCPNLTRSGIFTYHNMDGSLRKEYRPPEEVMKADSLDTYKGKPITIRHPSGLIKGDKAPRTIGSILSGGIPEGDNVRADITIYDTSILNSGMRELSLGYSLKLDETPGMFNGEHYDAVQRDIRINHLALVPAGRAGNARLRLDADGNQMDEDDKPKGEKRMENLVKIRLDSGLEYEAAPEIKVALEAAQNRADEAEKNIEALKGEKDALQAKLDSAEDDLKKQKEEMQAHVDGVQDLVKDRVALEKAAQDFKVEKMDELTDRQIKEAVILSVRGDSLDLKDKSDDYVQAAFDAAVDSAKADAAANQRRTVAKTARKDGNEGTLTLEEVRENARQDAAEQWKGEKK